MLRNGPSIGDCGTSGCHFPVFRAVRMLLDLSRGVQRTLPCDHLPCLTRDCRWSAAYEYGVMQREFDGKLYLQPYMSMQVGHA